MTNTKEVRPHILRPRQYEFDFDTFTVKVDRVEAFFLARIAKFVNGYVDIYPSGVVRQDGRLYISILTPFADDTCRIIYGDTKEKRLYFLHHHGGQEVKDQLFITQDGESNDTDFDFRNPDIICPDLIHQWVMDGLVGKIPSNKVILTVSGQSYPGFKREVGCLATGIYALQADRKFHLWGFGMRAYTFHAHKVGRLKPPEFLEAYTRAYCVPDGKSTSFILSNQEIQGSGGEIKVDSQGNIQVESLLPYDFHRVYQSNNSFADASIAVARFPQEVRSERTLDRLKRGLPVFNSDQFYSIVTPIFT